MLSPGERTRLRGVTPLHVAPRRRVSEPLPAQASSELESEARSARRRRAGPCNFTEEVSCLVTLSVMESSSFHYPRL